MSSFPSEVPKPTVKKRCAACSRRAEWFGGIVSPTGVEHHSADYGMTTCGKDATGDKWWWPL